MFMPIATAIVLPSFPEMNEDAGRPAESSLSADKQDILWMQSVARGDLAAFEQLIETHQMRLVGMITKMLGNDTDSEDIAQQVFIRLWKSAGRYRPTAKFTTWLFKIARNLVFNELRRRNRHPAIALDQEEEGHHFQAPDRGAVAPDAALLDGEMQKAIQQAIDSLPEIQRLAIILRRYEGMPYEEIAEVLKTSVPAVKSILFRARTELREKLKKYLES